MRTFFSIYLSLAVISLLITSCDKQDDWLDTKRNKSDVVPKTLKDFQALLDIDDMYMDYPAIGSAGADNYYVTETSFPNANQVQRNCYTWQADIFQNQGSPGDWAKPYTKILYANAVLEAFDKFDKNETNKEEADNIKGAALFVRAFAFFELAQLFAKPYDKNTAANNLGIIMPMTAEPSVRYGRSTVEETYNKITGDLVEAESLMKTVSANQVRPNKVAAQALLARVYLSMREYAKAFEWSDKALQSKSILLDLNNLTNSPGLNPLPVFGDNPEIIYYAIQIYGYSFIDPQNTGLVDSTLYKSYHDEDLRKSYYYDAVPEGYQFKGTYTGSYYNFSGLATNELYLIRAEAHARLGRLQESADDINTLLVKRWDKNVPFTPLVFATEQECVKFILEERRREMPFTGSLRWDDLRRTGLEPAYAQDITRVIGGNTYTLKANDDRYVYPIPANELRFNPVPQNPR